MIFQHIFAPIIDIIKHIFHKAYKYKSLNIITINAQAIMHNFYTFQKHKPAYTIIPVLKSNAYGHGIKQICQIINTIPECKLIAVDSYPEYQIIHKRSNKSILIMAETHASNYVLFDYKRTHVALWNKSTVKTLGSLGMKVNVHIFVNTGMNREGIRLEGLEDLLQEVSNHPNIHIIGIMSHLACADDPAHPLNTIQSDAFHTAVQIIKSFGHNPEYIHLEASGGMINDCDMHRVSNAGRLGLGLYGLDPNYRNGQLSEFGKILKPALDVYSTVTALESLNGNDSVGYSATWSASHNQTTATFGFGYKEGMDRAISGTGWKVKIQDHYCPLVGRISMNYTSCCLVQDLKGIALGEKVHILSSVLSDDNNIYKFYDSISRIPYEIVALDDKIKRIIL